MQATDLDSRSGRAQPVGLNAKKTALMIGTILVSINLWTGGPLLALWVGSHVVPSQGLTMTAFWVILGLLAVIELLLTVLLTRLNAAYDDITDRPLEARQSSPWLRSMRGERDNLRRSRYPASPIERTVAAIVVIALLVFEAWFFLFAHYTYPGGNLGSPR
jgi:hypothetical protein